MPGTGSPSDRAVPIGAGGREAERTGLDGLLHDAGHRGDVVVGRVLVAGAPLAHRVGPDRAVRDLGAEIDCEIALLDDVEVFAGSSPTPR